MRRSHGACRIGSSGPRARGAGRGERTDRWTDTTTQRVHVRGRRDTVATMEGTAYFAADGTWLKDIIRFSYAATYADPATGRTLTSRMRQVVEANRQASCLQGAGHLHPRPGRGSRASRRRPARDGPGRWQHALQVRKRATRSTTRPSSSATTRRSARCSRPSAPLRGRIGTVVARGRRLPALRWARCRGLVHVAPARWRARSRTRSARAARRRAGAGHASPGREPSGAGPAQQEPEPPPRPRSVGRPRGRPASRPDRTVDALLRELLAEGALAARPSPIPRLHPLATGCRRASRARQALDRPLHEIRPVAMQEPPPAHLGEDRERASRNRRPRPRPASDR